MDSFVINFFYTLTIDFVFALSKFRIDLNVLMSIICKFNKKLIVVFGKDT